MELFPCNKYQDFKQNTDNNLNTNSILTITFKQIEYKTEENKT